MTKLFESAIEAVRALPPAEQDEIARVSLPHGHDEPEEIDPRI